MQLRLPAPAPPPEDPAGWARSLADTREEFGAGEPEVGEADEPAVRRLLERLAITGEGKNGAVRDGPEEHDALRRALGRGWVAWEEGRWSLRPAGRVYLGERLETGAVTESATHRALLRAAVRIFAARGESLEILRQGRFDTRLPDARLRLLPAEPGGSTPERMAERLAERRSAWAWRAFGGRDVYVEAEVSGADRRDRLRRDLAKATTAAAHCLFLVPDPRRARKIRAFLSERPGPPPSATVWVLGPRVLETGAAGGSGSAGDMPVAY